MQMLMLYPASLAIVAALGWLVILSGVLAGWVARLLYRNRALRAALRDEILARQASQANEARLTIALQAARASKAPIVLRPMGVVTLSKGGTA